MAASVLSRRRPARGRTIRLRMVSLLRALWGLGRRRRGWLGSRLSRPLGTQAREATPGMAGGVSCVTGEPATRRLRLLSGELALLRAVSTDGHCPRAGTCAEGVGHGGWSFLAGRWRGPLRGGWRAFVGVGGPQGGPHVRSFPAWFLFCVLSSLVDGTDLSSGISRLVGAVLMSVRVAWVASRILSWFSGPRSGLFLAQPRCGGRSPSAELRPARG